MSGAPHGDVKVQPARRVAYDVLVAVRESDAYANLLLPTRIARAALDTADAALATELTYGTLRMRGYYDRVIALAAHRAVELIDPAILDVLRLGAHQLLSMRVAAHAAVNESVSLARSVGSRSATSFCNGVLRTISRSEPALWRERVLVGIGDETERLAAEFSHPAWIVRAMRHALVAEGAESELARLLAADNAAPRVNLAALPGIAEVPEGRRANRFSPIGFELAEGDPRELVERSGGRLRVQDEGSQLAVLALSRARPVARGERWLDLCAGPGGKAAVLAAEAQAAGATLIANEPVPARAELVARAMSAVLGNPLVWQYDGRSIGEREPAGFDRILLDAPCTGLGALRRRPEARWRKTPRDVAELAVLQAELLDAAVGALKPGGILAYVTCSPHLGESRVQVASARERWGGELVALDTPAVLRELCVQDPELASGSLQAQLWPHRHGTDAMFIALLTRSVP